MSFEEVFVLEQIYTETRSHDRLWKDSLYEVVWIPIVDPHIMNTDVMNTRFEEMRNIMPWYSVYNLSNADTVVQRSIRDRWHFRNKPILVVLDPQGREVKLNALHMMWIWGGLAFPFTTAREEALWREETWRLDLLVNGMDPRDDIYWIRKFTSNARAMARAAGIPLEMCYVGKSRQRENVRRAINTINIEKLSYYWQDLTMIKKLLSYDKDGSWGLLCHGSQILTIGHGSTMLQTVIDFDFWKEHILLRGFDFSLKIYHDKLHGSTNNCSRFDFPIVEGSIPEGMRCPECYRSMEKHIAFICCHDQTSLADS
ncbi:hypothetical protein QVD17_06743 [Tagetes erecta]|uniref:Sieve element occlusion C-terminal domain-containing protein n=1 Tax=Tagetes erecta TaxID=13708 RepID=A0AAD8P6S6_TARER|nr:hypothetical protein QVD17_06743 [Tagetes erecta]